MATLPEHFAEFKESRQRNFLRVKALKDRGENVVGTFCQYSPKEIIDAAGAYSVGLCGKSQEPIPLAETKLPANLCPLIKASYGNALGDTCPYAFFSDVISGETTCDGKKKMYRMLNEIKPTYTIHLPNHPDRERSVEALADEFREFAKRLEEAFGVTITDEKIREAIKIRNQERIQAAAVYELGRLDPPAITGYNMRHIMDSDDYYFDVKEKYEITDEVIRQCMEAYNQGEGPYKPDEHPVRVIISGAGLGGTEDKTVKFLEEAGGAVVCYEGCSGIVSRRRLVEESETKDPYLCLAEKYLEVPCAVMSPNSPRFDQIRRTIDEWRADGLICINLHSCHPFGIEAYNISRVCEEKGIPFMHIETDFSDSDVEQLRTRMEAFVELLKESRAAKAAKEAANG